MREERLLECFCALLCSPYWRWVTKGRSSRKICESLRQQVVISSKFYPLQSRDCRTETGPSLGERDLYYCDFVKYVNVLTALVLVHPQQLDDIYPSVQRWSAM